MPVAPFGKRFHLKMANWKSGRRNRRRARQQGRADIFILRFYGNADRADRWPAMEAEMWNDRAVEIWGMNYPGFGGSTGPARLARIGPAAVAAFDALRREAADAPIVAYGASIGATAALHVAASRPAEIAGLILHNPPPLARNDSASVWLVEPVAVGRSGRIADPARPRLHCKRESESCAGNLFAGGKRRDRGAAFSPAGGSGIRRRKTHHRIARRLPQRSRSKGLRWRI